MEAQQSHRCISAVTATRAVQAFDAFKRIPEEYRQTFFGFYDIWKYIPIFDVKLCPDCLMYAETVYYVGTYLRGLFKHLEIVDKNTINANVHPHCRCELQRVTDPMEYLAVTEGLF